MPTTIDTDAFGFLIGDLSRLIRAEMERRIALTGLAVTPGEGRTLVNIARIGAVRQNVLAERMGVEAMTLSGYLDRLEARGLIARSPDPADRRAKLVTLTPTAEGALVELRAIGQSLRDDLSGAIGEEEWTRLQERLKAIRAMLAEMKCAPPRRPEASA